MIKKFLKILSSVLIIGTIYLLFTEQVIAEAEEKEIRLVLDNFYTGIIEQNFGVAENYYKLPELGANSENPLYAEFKNSMDYFNYFYSLSEYKLNEYQILAVTKLNDDTFHAIVNLSGYYLENKDPISFTQDSLITQNNEHEWILSLEDYPKYMRTEIEKKNIKDLSEKEVIYKFFIEMDKGNYGVAAALINPSMSNLNGDKDKIIPYLKTWYKAHASLPIHVNSNNLYILNHVQVSNESSILLVSSQMTRADFMFDNRAALTFNTSSRCDPCSSPAFLFLETRNIEGQTLINIEDADRTLYSILNNSETKGDFSSNNEIQENQNEFIQSEIDNLSSTLSKLVDKMLLLIIPLLLFSIIIPVIKIFFVDSYSSRSSSRSDYSYRSRGSDRSNAGSSYGTSRNQRQNTDIAASVDRLLNENRTSNPSQSSSVSQPEPVSLNKSTNNLLKDAKRTIHLKDESLESRTPKAKDSSSSYKRKIYTDDE